MPITDNRSLLEKADTTLAALTSGGGILQSAQAEKFMQLLIKEAKLMSLATVVPLRAPKQLIEKIRFSSRVLHAGVEGTALAAADRSAPAFSKVEFDAQLFKGEVLLSNEALEDSIERGDLAATIMQILTAACARDLEEVAINGLTTSADPFLAQFNGLLAQAASNVVDASDTAISRTHLRNMLKAMPSEFLRNKDSMNYLTSVDAEIDFRDSIADRQTVLGDQYLSGSAPVQYNGINVVDIPMFPENIGTSSHCTDVLLTDPKNVNYGIWRDIRIETDKRISEGAMLVVVTLRFDCKFAEELAVVKAINVKVA